MSSTVFPTVRETEVPGRGEKNNGHLPPVFYTALPPLAVAVLFVVLWQVACTIWSVPKFLLPRPSDIAVAFVDNFTVLGMAFLVTTFEATVAFAVSALVGVIGAVLLSSSRLVERSFYPYAILLQTIPVIATAPLIILWFGVSLTTVVIIATIMAFVPVLSNTLVGLRSTDRRLVELFGLYGAGRFTALLRLRLPAAMPFIVTGLRIASSMAVIGVIVAEYLSGVGGTQPGLGFLITKSASRLDTPLLFAAGLSCALLGLLFFQLVAWVSRWLLGSWHESELSESH